MRATGLLPMAAAAFLFLTGTGCQYNPYANRFTTVKPLERDLPGIYIVCDQTVIPQVLRFPRGERGRIELRPDGTFVARNFPVWEEPAVGSYRLKHLEKRTGRWRLDTYGTVDNGGGDVKRSWGIRFKHGPDAYGDSWMLTLTSDRPPNGLIDTIGDPDSGQVVILEREGTVQAERAKRP